MSRARASDGSHCSGNQALARRWLLPVALGMANMGCLMTSTPQFTAQEHTAPFFVESTASPDPRAVVKIDTAAFDSEFPAFVFSADVVSQDDPTGPFSQVFSYLYLDYGQTTIPGFPFLYPIQGNPLAPGGTLEQTTPRLASATYTVGAPLDLSFGCHTATLVVSHHFDQGLVPCPTCANDYSMLTWPLLRCDSNQSPGCDDLPVSGASACPVQISTMPSSCPAIQATEDAGAESCAALTESATP